MSRDWIPFHASLRQGAKRGIPRAIRFIYLEVAHASRQYAGRLPLPFGFKTVEDALHDVLGGSFAEVKRALDVLTKPVDPDDETAMLRVEGERGRWILVVCAFDRWANADLSTDRVRRYREKQREQFSTDTVHETRFMRNSETATKRLEKRREEKNREEKSDPPISPKGGNVSPSVPSEPKKPRRSSAKTALPPDFVVSTAIEAMCRSEGLPNPNEVFPHFCDTARAKEYRYADWEAAFRNWMRSPITRDRYEPWSTTEPEPIDVPKAGQAPPGAVFVKGDPEKLQQVLSRLNRPPTMFETPTPPPPPAGEP